MKAMLLAACCAALVVPSPPAGAQSRAPTTRPDERKGPRPPEEASPANARAGVFKEVRGKVSVWGSDGVMRQVGPGDSIAAVDRIETDADAGAGVVLRDGTTLVLGPSSRLAVKEFHYDAATREGGMLLALVRGSMRMITGLIGKTNPEAVRIETQTITLGVRGTDFIVLAEAGP